MSEKRRGGRTGRSVFVTVGTDHHPFERLIAWIDRWQSASAPSGVETFVQYGTGSRPAVADGGDYVSHDDMAARISTAGAIVCHGGPGTIIDCLRSGTKPIVVPRRHALGEHVDDHQVRFSRRLQASGYVHVADTEEELGRLLDAALSGAPEFVAAQTEDLVRGSVERFAQIARELFPPDDGMRVLYIGGWGRSGSTLVDRLLGQVPGCFSVGEMRDIWLRGVLENRRCGCGEPFHECVFWTKVGDVAFGGWDRRHAEELHHLRMRYDRPWMPPLLVLRRAHAPGLDRYVDVTARLYRAIRDVSWADVIVDSTKIPSYALLLARIRGVDLRFLHLVRDSRGVVHSWNKSVLRPDATTRPDRMIRYGTASASGRYLLYNSTAGALRVSRIPYRLERYEDIVRDPRAGLRRILDFAGLRGAGLDFLEGDTAMLVPNHSVDGNPMRFAQGPLSIRADEEWRSRLDERDRRVVSAITGPLLRRYGYR
jgi:UDP-N-acetylglucosamine transferase subunit ALG13